MRDGGRHALRPVHHNDEVAAIMSPLKAKGLGELRLSGVAPAIANAVYEAPGVRLRDYPATLDKHIDGLPEIA
jgi:xanthine dehydrogenase YagR molybdenum-binding subunit